MLVSDKNALVLLGIVFLIKGHRWSNVASGVPFIVYELTNNYSGDPRNGFVPSFPMDEINILKTNTSHDSNATFADFFVNTRKYFTTATGEEIKEQNSRDNSTRTMKSKRLRTIRCPLNRPSCLRNSKPMPEGRSRFLEVFQIVQFEHEACASTSGLDGTCLHELNCQSSGGTGMGDCADGYGVCCVNLFLCDEKSAAPMGWFNNPDFPAPSSEQLSCAFTLDKTSKEIKQLRLDFAVFELLPPSGGVCKQDQFIVSGQNINNIVPILCGVNTGQHVYIEIGDVDGPIYFSVQTASSENRLFSIKITQLTQSDVLAAPSGCLQYFKGPHGYLESFNYRDKSDIGITRVPSYLNNLNYAMCIDRESRTCGITYSNEEEMQIVNFDSDGLPVIPPDQAGVEIFNCPSDWLLIAATRICGYRLNDGSVIQDFTLNAAITDTSAGPIVLWFRSDEGYVGRGFKLQYQQMPCLNPTK